MFFGYELDIISLFSPKKINKEVDNRPKFFLYSYLPANQTRSNYFEGFVGIILGEFNLVGKIDLQPLIGIGKEFNSNNPSSNQIIYGMKLNASIFKNDNIDIGLFTMLSQVIIADKDLYKSKTNWNIAGININF